MRINLLIALCLLLSISVSAQGITVTIKGLSPAVNSQLQPGELILCQSENESILSDWDFMVTAKNPGTNYTARTKVVNSVMPNEDGNYDFSFEATLESRNVNFNKELEIKVYAWTTFSNQVFTIIKVQPEDISKPIVIDSYARKYDNTSLPLSEYLTINISSPYESADIVKTIRSNKDNIKKCTRDDFHVQIKNKGDADWKVDLSPVPGSLSSKRLVKFKLPVEKFDFTKDFILRASVKTKNGNYLWKEIELKPYELGMPLYLDNNYSGAEFNNDIPASSSPITTTEDVETEDTSNAQDPEENESDEENTSTENSTSENSSTEENSESTNSTSSNTEEPEKNSSTSTETITSTTTVTNSPYEGATDLTTKTLKALCKTPAKGDTVLNINGSLVCVKSYKNNRGKEIGGMLALDCNLEQNGIIFPAKGGQHIRVNAYNGELIELTLRTDLPMSTEMGEFVLKNESKVIFNKGFLSHASLSENATLQSGNLTLKCAPNASRKHDIQFDKKGNVTECTLAEPLSVSDPVEFNFPADSRLELRSGNIIKVFTNVNTTFTLNDTKFTVKGDSKSEAYEFSGNGELEEVIAAEGNAIEIDGKLIPAEVGKVIKFEVVDGVYYVSKFFAAETVTIMVHGRKNKEVTVKAGKKIILEKGVVVKAG